MREDLHVLNPDWSDSGEYSCHLKFTNSADDIVTKTAQKITVTSKKLDCC